MDDDDEECNVFVMLLQRTVLSEASKKPQQSYFRSKYSIVSLLAEFQASLASLSMVFSLAAPAEIPTQNSARRRIPRITAN